MKNGRTCNVPQGPDGLFTDVGVGGGHQADEGRDGAPIHHSCRLLRASRRDVGERPGRLKLDGGAIRQCQEGHKARDEASLDDAVDGRVLLPGQELPAGEEEQTR